ncbi:MAG: hypothetical protein LLG20_22645 [Acidobacteriales bacterium]|nr:hypothetical protein [Terriglobales bacterium]
MTVNDIAKRLLTNFSPEEREIPDNATYPGRNDAVKQAINGALQELFGKGGPWVRKDEIGVRIYPTTSVTIAVTAGSTSATITTGWQAWMAGCTIVIDASEDNEIKNASASATLKYPYTGTTGTKNAIVYHDSITIGDDVLEVLDPVRLDRRPLAVTVSPHHQSVLTEYDDYGIRPGSQTPMITVDRVSDTAGTPVCYHVHTWIPDANTPSRVRMRLTPAPTSAGMLDYQAMLAPPVVTNLAASTTLPIPLGFDESVFLPVATMHLMGTSFFRAMGVPAAVQKSYDTAMELLAGSNPGKTNQIRFVTRG